ncbi:MAG: TPM domain-containing protein [Campylobacteraceae bacterium]|nr:TPM domain-containing protein [Campylobacteraceae bacterium]
MAAALLFLIPLFCSANESYIFNDDKIIGDKAVIKINEMGEELYRKSNISVYAFVSLSVGDESVNKTEYWSNFTKELKQPYVLLVMLTSDKVVDILYSPELEGKFDKAKILSPYPMTGSILPLLVLKKDYDNFTAAILNGFADLAEQIAESYNIVLESAIGSSNRSTMDWIRFVVYGMFALAFLFFIYKKVKYRYAKKEK